MDFVNDLSAGSGRGSSDGGGEYLGGCGVVVGHHGFNDLFVAQFGQEI